MTRLRCDAVLLCAVLCALGIDGTATASAKLTLVQHDNHNAYVAEWRNECASYITIPRNTLPWRGFRATTDYEHYVLLSDFCPSDAHCKQQYTAHNNEQHCALQTAVHSTQQRAALL